MHENINPPAMTRDQERDHTVEILRWIEANEGRSFDAAPDDASAFTALADRVLAEAHAGAGVGEVSRLLERMADPEGDGFLRCQAIEGTDAVRIMLTDRGRRRMEAAGAIDYLVMAGREDASVEQEPEVHALAMFEPEAKEILASVPAQPPSPTHITIIIGDGNTVVQGGTTAAKKPVWKHPVALGFTLVAVIFFAVAGFIAPQDVTRVLTVMLMSMLR